MYPLRDWSNSGSARGNVIRGLGIVHVGLMLGWAGCDSLIGGTSEPGSDTHVTPDTPFDPNTGECATNWRPVNDKDLGARAKVVNERLVLESQGGEVKVRGLLGAPHSPDRGAVLRFDFQLLALGPDGKLVIDMVSEQGTLASLIVQPMGAVLFVESIPYGSNAEIAFREPPDRLVFELDLQGSLAVEARAFFFEAGRGKVLSTGVPRFAGGMVTSLLSLSGATTEARLERFARIDPGSGGLMEDFWCDSLGLASDRFRFPEGRASKAGKACSHDSQCGAGEYCIEPGPGEPSGAQAVCRRACLASSQCLDEVCIVLEDSALCSVPAETCTPEPGLVCGGDGALRLGCEQHTDCPRAEDLCLGGACVSNDEAAVMRAGKSWGECDFGSERCSGDAIEVCDRIGPGWNEIERCGEGQCAQDDGEAFCDACIRSCVGEDVYASCDGGAATLAVDCRDGFEVCSTGDAANEPASCRPVIVAEPPASPVQVGDDPTWGIDPTEVSRAQYLTFLQSGPAIDSQRPECAWNTSFAPPDWPWFDGPHRAVQADHCDAVAYCASVGRRLCTVDEWHGTCSAGGTQDFPYGDAYASGVCSVDPRRDVGSSPECTGSGAFAGVYDMIGGVGEWLDGCVLGTTSVRAADSCKTRGTSASQSCDVERTLRRDSIAGIRCCAP